MQSPANLTGGLEQPVWNGDTRATVRALLYTTILFMILATVPWWFTEETEGRILGLPVWAAYTVMVSLVYAVVISWFVGKFWDEGEDEGGD